MKSASKDHPAGKSTRPSPPRGSVPGERPGPKGGKRDQNRRERAQALVEAAVGLFLERGIGGVTIDDITRAAGVSKGSFYRYFEDKEQLVAHALAPLTLVVTGAFETCATALDQAHTMAEMMEVYDELGACLAGALLEFSELVLLYLQESRAPAVDARAPVGELAAFIAEHAEVLTEIAHRHGVLREFPHRLSALAVVGAAERLVFDLLKGNDLGDPLAIPEQLASLILDGLASR